jgi:tetratricopeptide (TPR) repeat protein
MAALRRESGDVLGEDRVREHLALFRSELRAARALPALRVLSGRGLSPTAIAAGPHLLAELNLLEKVRASVEAQRPDLLPLFSPFAHIGLLVEEKEYGSAYGALERLDAAARDTFEVRELEARVQLELGLAALAVDRTDEAVAHWERALERAEVRAQVAVPISEAVLTRAKLLHSREVRDDAILLLQRALPLGERGILGVPLAHFLLERADRRIERASAGAGDAEADLGPAIAEMRGAVADLEEAVLLDPTNGGIRDRRNEAEDMLLALLARAGPVVVEPTLNEAVAAPPEEQAPAAVTQSLAPTRGSAMVAIGVALWVGIGLLVFVAYPLLMPQHLGGAGTLVVLGLAVGWIATNAIGWFFLR